MRIKSLFTIIAAVAIVCISAPLLSVAQSGDSADNRLVTSADYPWLKSDGSFLMFSGYWVKNGVQQFYRLNNRWPASWQEVKDAGLFSATLVNFANQPVDPDSTSVLDYGDVRYIPPSGDGNPQLVQVLFLDGPYQKMTIIEQPEAFEQELARVAAKLVELGKNTEARELQSAMSTPEARFQNVISTMITRGIEIYPFIHNNYPESLAELFASGVGPFSPGTVNPLTGQPYKGNGSALDYSYYMTPAQGDQPAAFYLNSVNADGKDTSARLMTN
jgi:hypothetical protein